MQSMEMNLTFTSQEPRHSLGHIFLEIHHPDCALLPAPLRKGILAFLNELAILVSDILIS